jgi:hypothetical protein
MRARLEDHEPIHVSILIELLPFPDDCSPFAQRSGTSAASKPCIDVPAATQCSVRAMHMEW